MVSTHGWLHCFDVYHETGRLKECITEEDLPLSGSQEPRREISIYE